MGLLVEKYRPDDFDKIIGQKEIVKQLKIMTDAGDIPHLLLLGGPGTGKTTVAYCVCKALFGENWRRQMQMYNASSTRGIDTVRGPLTRLVRMTGRRVVALDEFDNFTPDAQEAMRGIMDKASEEDTRFILTGNYEDKIIGAIKSRCIIYRFEKLDNNDVLRRILFDVLPSEGVSTEEIHDKRKEIETLVNGANGDMRQAINRLVITKNKKLEISSKGDPFVCDPAFLAALEGDGDKAQDLIETACAKNSQSSAVMIDSLYVSINKNVNSQRIKRRLLRELSDTAHRCKRSHSVVVHLVAFISYVWIVKYLPDGCPIKEGDD